MVTLVAFYVSGASFRFWPYFTNCTLTGKKKKDALVWEWASVYLDISVDDLVLVQVPEPLQDLSGVEDDGRLLQRAPFRPQQRGQASWRKERRSVQNLS